MVNSNYANTNQIFEVKEAKTFKKHINKVINGNEAIFCLALATLVPENQLLV